MSRNLVEIAHQARDRRVIVVILVRGEAKHSEVAVAEGVQPPGFVVTQQFLVAKKLFLDE